LVEFYHSNFIINTNGISSKFTIDHNRELKFLDVEVGLSDVVKMNLIDQLKQTLSTSVDNSHKALNYRL
jgi:hypothetical protein